MYKLIYEREDMHAPYSAVSSVIMEIDDERNVDEMLQAYKEFLCSTGFVVKGEIIIEEQE